MFLQKSQKIITGWQDGQDKKTILFLILTILPSCYYFFISRENHK